MKEQRLKIAFLIFLIIVFFISACDDKQTVTLEPVPPTLSTSEPAATSSSTLPSPTATPTQETILETGVTQSYGDWMKSDGPYLLLEINFGEYAVLDMETLTLTPFTPPIPAINHSLSWGISPSGEKMIWENNSWMVITDLASGIRVTEFLYDDFDTSLQPALMKEAFLAAYPETGLSEEDIMTAMQNQANSWQGKDGWYLEDRYRLSVLPCSKTATCLFLEDNQTGTRTQLKDQPGLVRFWTLAPGGQNILIKKDYVGLIDISISRLYSEPEIWQDDHFYLIDMTTQQTTEIPLPEDIDEPAVYWINADLIGISHQHQIVDSQGFSLFDPAIGETRLITSESFDIVWSTNDHLLVLDSDPDQIITTLDFLDLEGEKIKQTEVDDLCFYLYSSQYLGQPLLSCETFIYQIDDQLNLQKYVRSIELIEVSPDQNWVIYTLRRSDDYFIENRTTGESINVPIPERPLEIIWRPDSAGFLYRSLTALYYYDLGAGKDTFITSLRDMGDYTNLNAVWISPE